ERGLSEAPLLAIGDGALGLWAALDEVFPTTRHQRCWNHRTLNVLDKLPKRLQSEMRKKLHALAEAPTRQECERRRDALCARLRDLGQEPAAACLARDWEDFVSLYDFPEEHWVHLRTRQWLVCAPLIACIPLGRAVSRITNAGVYYYEHTRY